MLWLSVTLLSEYAEAPPRLLTSRVAPVVYEAPELLSIRTAVRVGAAPLKLRAGKKRKRAADAYVRELAAPLTEVIKFQLVPSLEYCHSPLAASEV